MNMKKYIWDPRDSIMYVFEEENHILIIDPIVNDEVLEACSRAVSVTVLLTHEHFDHICGLNKLRNVLGKKQRFCSVISNEKCSERIKNIKTNMSAYAEVLAQLSNKQLPANWTPFTCEGADVTFGEKYSFVWMGHSVKLFYTPGHSDGSCCIVVDGDKLFVGDSILESCLMVKFPCSNKKIYKEVTIPLLEKLLAKVKFVCPGHGNIMTSEEALGIVKSVENEE